MSTTQAAELHLLSRRIFIEMTSSFSVDASAPHYGRGTLSISGGANVGGNG
jgi:hypothetical protein